MGSYIMFATIINAPLILLEALMYVISLDFGVPRHERLLFLAPTNVWEMSSMHFESSIVLN